MDPYPELVVHRHGPDSLEDNLRETVRNAPYLGLALFVHLLVLFVFVNVRHAVPAPDLTDVIKASTEARVEAFDPVVEPPPKVLEQPPEPIETPTVTETPVEQPTPVESPLDAAFDAPPSLADLTSVNSLRNAELGTGTRGESGFGRPGGGGPGPGAEAGVPTNDAVFAALLWLKQHQAREGHWSASAFDDECDIDEPGGPCDGRGSPLVDTGVSGLALLAFLGAGNTDRSGPFQATVKRGLRYLVDVQAPDGSLAPPNAVQGTYDHAIATLALVEGYTRARGSVYLKKPAQRALDALAALRTPGTGWRYMPDHPEMAIPGRTADTSVTGWAVLALAAGRKAGLRVDETAWDDALAFLDEMTDPVTGRTGYLDPGGPVAREAGADVRWPEAKSEAMTAVGLLCRMFADPDLADPRSAALVDKAVERLVALPPDWSDSGRRDYYGWYYGAYAVYQVGGRAWRVWEKALLDNLLPAQHRDGERKGSWDPQHDPWGRVGGRVYATAINALTLEVYYRYDRLAGSGR